MRIECSDELLYGTLSLIGITISHNSWVILKMYELVVNHGICVMIDVFFTHVSGTKPVSSYQIDWISYLKYTNYIQLVVLIPY